MNDLTHFARRDSKNDIEVSCDFAASVPTVTIRVKDVSVFMTAEDFLRAAEAVGTAQGDFIPF